MPVPVTPIPTVTPGKPPDATVTEALPLVVLTPGTDVGFVTRRPRIKRAAL